VCEPFRQYRGRESDFITEVLGVKLWAAEREIVRSFFNEPKTSVRSSRKTGKTFTIACCILAAVIIYECIIVSVAPTRRQVQDLLWAHIRDLHAKSRQRLPGQPDMTQLRLGPRHFAVGFSTDKPERILGFHSDVVVPDDPDKDVDLATFAADLADRVAEQNPTTRLWLVFDEAPGIAQVLYDAVKGSLSGPNARIFLQGNPAMDPNEEHEFAASHREGSTYHRIKIASLDADDPVGADAAWCHVPNWLVAPEWIEERRVEWGEDSTLFKAHVLGQFAGPESECRVITLTMLEAALTKFTPTSQGRHIGVDIARYGADRCVAALWVDGEKLAVHEWKGDLMETVDVILALRTRWSDPDEDDPIPAHHIHIDATGMGGGPVDRLRQLGVYVDAVDFGSKAVGAWPSLVGEDVCFKNRRAEMHWVFRRALQEGVARMPRELHGKPNVAWREAQWPEYAHKETANGTEIRVLPKDEIKAKYGRSPDHLDADLLAWCRGLSGATFGSQL